MFVCWQKTLKHMGTGRKFRNSKSKCYKKNKCGVYVILQILWGSFALFGLFHACFTPCIQLHKLHATLTSQPGEQAEMELLSEGSRGVSKAAVVWLPRLSDFSALPTYLTRLLLLRPIRTCATVMRMRVDLFQNKQLLREPEDVIYCRRTAGAHL